MPKPLSTDPYDILLGHNRWATRVLLDKCEALSEEQFHQRFDIGPGSLHDTLSHIIGAMFRWNDRIANRPLRPSIEGRAPGDHSSPITRHTPAELRELLEEATDAFGRIVAAHQAAGALAHTRDWAFGPADKPEIFRFTIAAAVIHVTNHGMHHRAQCMNMLKRLGKPVEADLDELEWQIAGEP